MGKNNFRKIATITLFESAVQWYCFLLYGTAAGTVFHKVFFSQTGNGTTALILSYMSFAIGYIAGPFGAIFFGHIGDRKGRKVTMYASLLMMGISTSIIGILPPAASAAPITMRDRVVDSGMQKLRSNLKKGGSSRPGCGWVRGLWAGQAPALRGGGA